MLFASSQIFVHVHERLVSELTEQVCLLEFVFGFGKCYLRNLFGDLRECLVLFEEFLFVFGP